MSLLSDRSQATISSFLMTLDEEEADVIFLVNFDLNQSFAPFYEIQKFRDKSWMKRISARQKIRILE